MLTIDPKLEPRAAARALAKRLKRASKSGDDGDLSNEQLAAGMERIIFLMLALCMIDELRLAKRVLDAVRDWLEACRLEARAYVERRGDRLRMIEELIAVEPALSRTFRDVLVEGIGADDWRDARRELKAESAEAREALTRDAPTIFAGLEVRKRKTSIASALARALGLNRDQR